MSDEVVVGEDGVEQRDRPRQTVRLMPRDDLEVGPFFPSGMNTVEAALAGATANMSDEQVARLRGEVVEREESDDV